MPIRALSIFAILTFFCSVTYSSTARPSDKLLLNGTAVHTSLQLDYYYAALFSESLSPDPQQLLWQDNLRMEMTILVDEWSKRRFTQHIGQAIAINNTVDSQKHNANDIATFKTLVKDYLIRGDRIIINKDSDTGTTIAINGITLMKTDNHEFFSLILNSWIGARPPSSGFKASILGQQQTIDSSMITSYESLAASTHRTDAIKSWQQKTPPKKKTVAKITPKEKVPTSQPLEFNEQPEFTRQSEPIAIETNTNYINAAELIASTDLATSIASEHSPVAIIEDDTMTTQLKKASDELHLDAEKDDETPVILASASSNNNLASEVLSDINNQKQQANLKLLRFYRSTILTSTYKKIVYPSSAINKNQQGKVVLKVKINRQGIVKAIDIEEKSKFTSLNKAANKAVTKAHYPSAPSDLIGDEFEFLLPIKFSLN